MSEKAVEAIKAYYPQFSELMDHTFDEIQSQVEF